MRKGQNRGRRGTTLTALMMVIVGLGAVIAIGFDARVTELRFSDRSRCRAAARWAAESAVARGRARLEARRRTTALSGTLDDGVRYTLEIEKDGGKYVLVGRGECTSQGRTIVQTVEVSI